MYLSVVLLAYLLLTANCNSTDPDTAVAELRMYLTTPNQEALFERVYDRVDKRDQENPDNSVIEIAPSRKFQEMDGFGYTLTGGSAIQLMNMNSEQRASLLNELFGPGQESIGVSYLRVSIGSSDLDPNTFSYNDVAGDVDMVNFSLEPDKEYLIPALKEILSINPDIKIMGSPWSAPVWMKSNNSTVGGRLEEPFYDAYAQYLARYIKEMQKEGIEIDAITVQNEPENPYNNPSMVMTASEQRDFIKDNLGPLFEEQGIETKIIIWDHNADNPGYPISILNDTVARDFIDGSAFHLYAGDISALSLVKEEHPDKNIYFTEQWIGAPANFSADFSWHIKNLIVGASRNWSKNVLQWNLAADPNQDPHTDGGCDRCLGALTIEGNSVSRNPAYYIIAHASKFVDPGSYRIFSTLEDGLPNVAFENTSGEIVLIVMNETETAESVDVKLRGHVYSFSLIPGAVATVVF